MKLIRLLVADSQTPFRAKLRRVLSSEPDFEIVGEAAQGEQTVHEAQRLQPDLVLMDSSMPRLDGISAIRKLRAAQSRIAVLVLATLENDEQVFGALRAGASGYLLKNAPPEKIVEASRAVVRGEIFLQPSVAATVVAEFNRLSRASARPEQGPLTEPLSEREMDILRKLVEGKSNKEIGAALTLAEGTVKNYLTNIFAKMRVLDRTQAALLARDYGWV